MASCYHCNMMREYYAIREGEEQEAENQGYGYEAETRDYWSSHPRTTFKDFLMARKDEHA